MSEIDVPISIAGTRIYIHNFQGLEGKLVLRRSIDFHDESEVQLGRFGQLEFRTKAGEELTIHSNLNSGGEGLATVFDSDILIKSAGRLKVGIGGSSPVAESEGRLEGHGGGWVLDGGTTTIENGGVISVQPNGVLNWKNGNIDGGNLAVVELFNDGLIDITGSGDHQLNCVLSNRKQLVLASSITGTGKIFNTNIFGGSTVYLDNRTSDLDIGVFFSNTQKVIAEFQTNATFSKPVNQLSDNSLSGGEWTVKDEAQLTLTPTSGSINIDTIRDHTFVELRGSGDLNGLRNAVGDLDVIKSSSLQYRDVQNASVSGQLDLLSAGTLRMYGSTLTVSGDLEMGSNYVDLFGLSSRSFLVVDETSNLIIQDLFEVLSGGFATINGTLRAITLDIENGGSFGGSGTINGSLFTNSGMLLPGSSPGTLTIDGDFSQTETGVLVIEVGGTMPGGEHDTLVVNGTATLGGALRIEPLDGVTVDGLEVVSLTAESIVGNFDRVYVAATSARALYDSEIVGVELHIASEILSVSTYGEWSAGIDTPEGQSLGTPSDDPEGDDLSNLMEYAFDLNPWQNNQSPIAAAFELEPVDDTEQLVISFPWAKNMTDVDYTVQVSFDLETWDDLEVEIIDSQDEGTHDLLTLKGAIEPTSETSRFARVQVKEIDSL